MAGKAVAATTEEEVVLPVPRRVEFFSVLGVWGYRRCTQTGETVDAVDPEWVQHADAIDAAKRDAKNAGLTLVV